jgi:hypothetical protein
MSIQRKFPVIRCDRCGKEREAHDVQADNFEIRRVSYEYAKWWGINGQDLCPECLSEMPASHQTERVETEEQQ